MTRLQSLRHRKERLIQANQINHYTQTSHPKALKYYQCMLSIRKEINDIECVNVHPVKAMKKISFIELFELNKN